MPASREPVSLLAVDRAVSEFRRGRPVALRGAGGDAALTLASEAAMAEGLVELGRLARAAPAVVLTARRPQVLGLAAGTPPRWC